jgi:hypothetical protein
LDETAFEALLPTLAEALHPQVRFGTDAEGYLILDLDPSLVSQELSRHGAVTSTSPKVMADQLL